MGVLESQIRIDTVAAGLDPTIGYLHANTPGRVALVYDLMEPQRPVMDRAMIQFITDNHLSPGDITVAPNGVCRLHPQLARVIASTALRIKIGLEPDAMTRKLELPGVRLKRGPHWPQFAEQFLLQDTRDGLSMLEFEEQMEEFFPKKSALSRHPNIVTGPLRIPPT